MRKYLLPMIVLSLAIALGGCVSPPNIRKSSQIQKPKPNGVYLTDKTVRNNSNGTIHEYLRNMRQGIFWGAVSYFDAEKKLEEFNEKNPIPCPEGYTCSQWEIPNRSDWENWNQIDKDNSEVFTNKVRKYPYWTSEKHCNQQANFCLPWEYAFWIENKRFIPQNLKDMAFLFPVRYNSLKNNLESKTK